MESEQDITLETLPTLRITSLQQLREGNVLLGGRPQQSKNGTTYLYPNGRRCYVPDGELDGDSERFLRLRAQTLPCWRGVLEDRASSNGHHATARPAPAPEAWRPAGYPLPRPGDLTRDAAGRIETVTLLDAESRGGYAADPLPLVIWTIPERERALGKEGLLGAWLQDRFCKKGGCANVPGHRGRHQSPEQRLHWRACLFCDKKIIARETQYCGVKCTRQHMSRTMKDGTHPAQAPAVKAAQRQAREIDKAALARPRPAAILAHDLAKVAAAKPVLEATEPPPPPRGTVMVVDWQVEKRGTMVKGTCHRLRVALRPEALAARFEQAFTEAIVRPKPSKAVLKRQEKLERLRKQAQALNCDLVERP